MTGYFTLEKYIVGRRLDELERILGYAKGRLAQGADIYVLARLPEPGEFELRGYTTWPHGGLPGFQRVGGSLDVNKLKRMVRAEAWSLSGRNRPVKVVPKKGGNVHPVGLGVPQWELIKPVPVFFLKSISSGDTVLFRNAYDIPLRKEEKAPAKEAPSSAPEPAKKKTWVEIELVDEDGNLIPNVRYDLELPDGKKTSGTLTDGRMRVSDIDQGTCKISFPDYDASEWDLNK